MSELLDPTGELQPLPRDRRARLSSLDGKTVALLDISKPGGDIFLDHLDRKLKGMGIRVRRYRKPTFTRIAPADLKHRIVTECDAVIEALAD